MVGGNQLLIETADEHIAGAEVRQITLSGITLADRFDNVWVCIHFEDITHMSCVGRDA